MPVNAVVLEADSHSEVWDGPVFEQTGPAMGNAVEIARALCRHLPADLYAPHRRRQSLAAWVPWPGNSGETLPDWAFLYYTYAQDRERLPCITSFYGHTIVFPLAQVEYVARTRKSLQCFVTLLRAVTGVDGEADTAEEWVTVPAVQGDNNHIRLLEALPGETERDLGGECFLTEPPLERDVKARIREAYGAYAECFL